MSNSISDHLYTWEDFFGRKAKKKNTRLFPHTIFGAFGVKEIGESLRVWRCHFNVLKIISSSLSIFGTQGSFVILLPMF